MTFTLLLTVKDRTDDFTENTLSNTTARMPNWKTLPILAESFAEDTAIEGSVVKGQVVEARRLCDH